MGRSSTTFSGVNQPTKSGAKRGRKKGVKIGNIYIDNQLKDITGEQLTKYTPLTTNQILHICNFLMLQNARTLKAISEHEEVSNIIKAIVDELQNPKRSMDFIFGVLDKLIKAQGVESDELQIEINKIKLKEVKK
jgi:hypothetical protein